MSRFHSYLSSAIKIINTHSAGKPLALHLKNFFGSDKKFGSRDRKMIASVCYSYFRTAIAFNNIPIEEKIFNAVFLCEHTSNEFLHFFKPELNEKIDLPRHEKMLLSGVGATAFFPFSDESGDGIDKEKLAMSFLIQPATYLRSRPGKERSVIDKLADASVDFELVSEDCFKLAKNIAVDKILRLNKDAVVQDMNSQKVLDYLDTGRVFLLPAQRIPSWDCCAASGGKSILLYDKLKGNIQLTVSDVRVNILLNLEKRLQQAAVNINRSFITDLSVSSGLPANEKFPIIICDVPCTGSGTWSRAPEQLFHFDKKMIDIYADRQRKIIAGTIPHLSQHGLFFYITCSVFKKENEEAAGFIKEKFHLQLMQMEYLKGYENAADTMFVAVFKSG